MIMFRTGYNYDTDEASFESGLACKDQSLAVQAERDESDINTIVRRFGLTGSLPVGVRAPTYGDFSGVMDYRDALEAIEEANASFYRMPAEVRSRFENNPSLFVDFCSDPLNLNEMKALGLTKPDSAMSGAGTASDIAESLPAGGLAQSPT